MHPLFLSDYESDAFRKWGNLLLSQHPEAIAFFKALSRLNYGRLNKNSHDPMIRFMSPYSVDENNGSSERVVNCLKATQLVYDRGAFDLRPPGPPRF